MKKICGIAAVFIGLLIIAYFVVNKPDVAIVKADTFAECATVFSDNLVIRLNSKDTLITVAGTEVKEFGYDFYVSKNMNVMVEADFLKSLISCSVLKYSDGRVLVMKGNHKLLMRFDSAKALLDDETTIELKDKVEKDQETGKIMIPFDPIAEYLSYSVQEDFARNWIDLTRNEPEILLPSAYDMRDYDRVSKVRDQGRFGTCWAFASLGALESTLLPEDRNEFSTDHMTLCNSYSLDLNKGGENAMSIAYLAAWQGPVYEKDDPYGDGVANENLKAVKHLEEAIVINNRDMDVLKTAIYRYGGIETSLYLQMSYTDTPSEYYSESTSAYYYNGLLEPNHDVVVVGWDDDFKKENFAVQPKHNGAFICKNSWGKEFGEDGYFYVSYDDVNLCNKAVVYSRVGEADNYDKIYQSDLLGWVGLMGFGKEEAYFANVYKAGAKEELAAVSFYATDSNTEYEVYLVQDFKNADSLRNRKFLVSGSMQYAGYYTIDLPEAVRLEDYKEYAVVVKIKTPGVEHPIAIEYNADERTTHFDITDGKGFISLYGELWHSAEETQSCNVCLKAFTNRVLE